MKVLVVALSLLITVLGIPAARAQTTIDVAKITCRQFLIGKFGASTRSVANWLSGYYNGKQGTTVIEGGAMEKNQGDLERYCRKHHDMPVMDAAKHALGLEK
jgi:acid stress chaperone HdeB